MKGAKSLAGFDRLEESIERAAGTVLGLRERSERLQELLAENERRTQALEAELAARPERDWAPELEAERGRVAALDRDRGRIAEQLQGWIQRLAALEA